MARLLSECSFGSGQRDFSSRHGHTGGRVNTVHVVKGKAGYYLRLVSPNGETLATSEAYRTRWGAKRAAAKNFRGFTVKEVPE